MIRSDSGAIVGWWCWFFSSYTPPVLFWLCAYLQNVLYWLLYDFLPPPPPFFWPLCVVCRTPLTGIKPGSLQWEPESLNHWITREVLQPAFWLNLTSRRLGEWEERESLACFGMYFLAVAPPLAPVLIRLPKFRFFPLSLQGSWW